MLLTKVIYRLIFPFDVVLVFISTLNKKIDARPPKDCTVLEKMKYRIGFAIRMAKYIGHERIGVEYKDKDYDKIIEKYLKN